MNLTSLTRYPSSPGTYTDVTRFPGGQHPKMIEAVACDKMRQNETLSEKISTGQKTVIGPCVSRIAREASQSAEVNLARIIQTVGGPTKLPRQFG